LTYVVLKHPRNTLKSVYLASSSRPQAPFERPRLTLRDAPMSSLGWRPRSVYNSTLARRSTRAFGLQVRARIGADPLHVPHIKDLIVQYRTPQGKAAYIGLLLYLAKDSRQRFWGVNDLVQPRAAGAFLLSQVVRNSYADFPNVLHDRVRVYQYDAHIHTP
jgi:hypothetical protein